MIPILFLLSLKLVNQVLRSADIPFGVVFNPVKNSNTGIFSNAFNPKDILDPIQDLFVQLLNELQEANDFI